MTDNVSLDFLGEKNWKALRRGTNEIPQDGDEGWSDSDFEQLIADLQALGEVIAPNQWVDPGEDSGDVRNRYRGRQLDRKVQTTIRTESFRKDLFGNAERFECALCGRELSVNLLWASHIKPRSACTTSEKADVNVVMSNCLLGCDQLFERRIVAVDDEGVIRLANLTVLPGFTAEEVRDLVEQVGVKLDQPCSIYGPHNASYFSWHLTNSGGQGA